MWYFLSQKPIIIAHHFLPAQSVNTNSGNTGVFNAFQCSTLSTDLFSRDIPGWKWRGHPHSLWLGQDNASCWDAVFETRWRLTRWLVRRNPSEVATQGKWEAMRCLPWRGLLLINYSHHDYHHQHHSYSYINTQKIALSWALDERTRTQNSNCELSTGTDSKSAYRVGIIPDTVRTNQRSSTDKEVG